MADTACGVVGWQSTRKEDVPSAPGQLAHFNKGCAVRAVAVQHSPVAFSVPNLVCVCSIVLCT